MLWIPFRDYLVDIGVPASEDVLSRASAPAGRRRLDLNNELRQGVRTTRRFGERAIKQGEDHASFLSKTRG